MAARERLLTRNFDLPDSHRLETYHRNGGYEALRKALAMAPAAITEEVRRANLRGLGGAGFGTGMKWGFVPKVTGGKPVYLVVNADEGEPGTFKDRHLLERAPHLVLEGMAITAFAVGARRAFVYIRGEYVRPYRTLAAAIEEAARANLLGPDILGSGFDLEITLHRGAGAYICGEETGLLESLEGKKGWPRLKPPFPAVVGAFGCPTVINNVETLALVPPIIARGAEWFAGLGTNTQGGTRIYSVSGHVRRPGPYELPVSATLRELIEEAGGVRDGHRLKAVVPGGSSAAILRAEEIDCTLDVDGLKAAGSMAGSAGVVVMDETTCIVEALYVVARFYAHESCGQCTPCRESTGWIYRVVGRILQGKGRPEDPDQILDIARKGLGTTICAFYDGAVGPYLSYIEKFRPEFDHHIRTGGCDVQPGRVPVLTGH